MALRVRVPSPPIPPPRWPNLVAAVGGENAILQATAANSGGDNRWEAGFTFQPNDCDFDSGDPISACDGSSFTVDTTADLDTSPEADPLYYWTASRCSTLGSTNDEITARSRSKLQVSTSHKLEKEFWTNAVHTALGLDSQSLTSAFEPLGVTANSVVPALSYLAQYYGNVAQGQRGMLHVAPFLANILYTLDMIRWDSGYLLDAFGNIVVAGTGYDGSSPDGTLDTTYATTWAYMTTIPVVRLSAIDVIDRGTTRVDATNNVNTSIAYRAGAVSLDPCAIIGVNVDVSDYCGSAITGGVS